MLVQESLTRTVYLGKLPYNVTELELWSFLASGGWGEGNGRVEGGGVEKSVELDVGTPPEGAVRIPRNSTG